MRKTSKCVTLADNGCGRAAQESVSARWTVGPLLYVRANRYGVVKYRFAWLEAAMVCICFSKEYVKPQS